MPVSYFAVLGFITTPFIMLGNLLTPRFVRWQGRKIVTSLTTFFITVIIIVWYAFYNGTLWLTLAFSVLGGVVSGVQFTAQHSLILEQRPQALGTMMAISKVANTLGVILGTGIGGMLLIRYDYELTGIMLGAFGMIAVVIFVYLVDDPTGNECKLER